jgi:hypothetical protein
MKHKLSQKQKCQSLLNKLKWTLKNLQANGFKRIFIKNEKQLPRTRAKEI